jgi:hypothetical protein
MLKRSFIIATIALLGLAAAATRASNLPEVRPDWNKPTTVVKTSITMEVCVEPPMRREKSTHDALFHTLSDLKGDYARLAFWYPYPKLAVAELEPPTKDKTSWDFSLIDPIVADFINAANGRRVMINISTIPQWMFKTPQQVRYPADPDEIMWTYDPGSELRDPSLREVRDYFVRLVSWYTLGGFTDELGHRHESGHHYKIDAWEVLNEADYEHEISPQLYTRIYDEVVAALKALQPAMKFSGPAVADTRSRPDYFEYFLDAKNHKPGIPIDMVSYHIYVGPQPDESPDVQQHSFFREVDGFISTVKYLEVIHQRLAPHAMTFINELGTVTSDNFGLHPIIAPTYWNLSGATFAYAYLQLVKLQIDLIAGAELINYPAQFPGASMTDWNTGLPNARYQAMKLLRDEITPGDRLVENPPREKTVTLPQDFAAQGFLATNGERKVLVINKRERPLHIHLPGAAGARVDYVDVKTGSGAPASRRLESEDVTLDGFAVAVVHLIH